MLEPSPINLSWLTLVLVGAMVGFLGVLVGFFLAGGRKREPQEMADKIRLRIETQKRLLDSAERANHGLQHAMEILEWAAGTDRLTGAWNRRRFEEAATAEMALVRRRKGPVSLMILDLDFFKNVNDNHGHNTGDLVLVEMARIIRDQLRASDTLARWGGEEFIVLSPATRLEGAVSLAEKIRGAVAKWTFPDVGQVTVSIGVAEYALGEELVSWIKRADEALYRAKNDGRNRVLAGLKGYESDEPLAPLIEVQWEDSYASGHPTIDAQHRKLFTLANSLIGAISSKQPGPEIAMRLRRLMAHTAQHFHDEEAILARVGYTDLSAHAAEHVRLLERAGRFEADINTGQIDTSQFIGFLILDLVQGHILIEDQHFFSQFQPTVTKDLTHLP